MDAANNWNFSAASVCFQELAVMPVGCRGGGCHEPLCERQRAEPFLTPGFAAADFLSATAMSLCRGPALPSTERTDPPGHQAAADPPGLRRDLRIAQDPCRSEARGRSRRSQAGRATHAPGRPGRDQPRRSKRFTRRGSAPGLAPDLVQRDFTAPAPNRLWGTDLTMIPTLEEPLGLSAVCDAFSRRVVEKHYADQTAAEPMNLKPRQPVLTCWSVTSAQPGTSLKAPRPPHHIGHRLEGEGQRAGTGGGGAK